MPHIMGQVSVGSTEVASEFDFLLVKDVLGRGLHPKHVSVAPLAFVR